MSKNPTANTTIDLSEITDAQHRDFVAGWLCGAFDEKCPYTVAPISEETSSSSTADYFFWQGEIPRTGGLFYCPNGFNGEKIREWAQAEGMDQYNRDVGKGLQDAWIDLLISVNVEIDSGPDFLPLSIEEQRAHLEVLVALGLLRPNTESWSGGKSLHLGWTCTPMDRVLWEKIQRGLVVLFRSDVSCMNIGRKYRRGGSDWDGRPQPLLSHHTEVHDPQELLEAVEVCLEEMGVEDVDKAFAALSLANQLWNLGKGAVKKQDFDTAAELQAQARLLLDLLYIPEDLQPLVTGGTVKGTGTKYKAINGGDCPADTLFETRNGTLGTADQLLKGKDKVAVCCAFHADKSPSAVLFKGNPHRLFCSSCATTWKVAQLNEGGAVTPNMVEAMPQVQVVHSDGEYVGLNRWHHGPLGDAPGIHFLAAHTGSGKTTITAAASEGKSTLQVGPTIRLTNQLAGKFDSKSYQEVSGDIFDQRAAVCIPSLHRVSTAVTHDLLLADEWEGLRGLLYDSTSGIMVRSVQRADQKWYKEPTNRVVRDRMAAKIKQTLEAGGQLVVADANLSKSGIEDILEMAGPDYPAYVHFAPEFPKPMTGRCVDRYRSDGGFLRDLVADAKAGKSGTIACDSKASVEKLAALLENAAGVAPKDILTIHRESTDEIDPDTWDGYQYVIFNQAAGSGVSYTGKRHDHSYVYATCWGPQVGWDDLIQLSSRNRVGVHRKYFVKERTHGLACGYEEYVKKAEERAGGAIHEADLGAFHGRCSMEYLRAQRGKQASKDFYARLKELGALISDVESGTKGQRKKAEKLARELGISIKEARIDAVMDAPLLADDEAKELRELKDQFGSLDACDQAKLEKRITVERWGQANRDLAADTITTSREWVRAKSAASTDDLQHNEGGIIKMLDQVETANGFKKSQGRNRYLRFQVLMELLDMAGAGAAIRKLSDAVDRSITESKTGTTLLNEALVLDQIAKGGDLPRVGWTNAILEENGFVQRAKELDAKYGLAETLGYKVPEDWSKHGVQYLGHLLASIGFQTKRAKFQGERRTTLDLEKAIAWTALRVRASAQLQGIPVTVDGERGLSHEEKQITVLEGLKEFLAEYVLNRNNPAMVPTG